jgi:asparagine synthase (glutamine-hydrolysing)
MCGLIGQFSYTRIGLDLQNCFPELVQMMARRGPDDEGVWTDGQHCILGFRRLSILDLSLTGHQPMMTEDLRYSLVFNGEVYNYQDLGLELEREGVRFRSSGDAEVVLYALAHWGISALERFNGMFALGFYDCHEKRLLLGRDHAGIKPLYYLKSPDGILFASQYDQIIRHPWCKNMGISTDGLALYMRLGFIPAPYAILQNTHMLEPGEWLTVDAHGEFHAGKHYSFPMYRIPDLSGQEAYGEVDAVILRAVHRHLISDVPVGTFLSGGIDSPLVASKISQAISKPIEAFTIGVEGDPLDESTDAIQYARELGLDQTVKFFTPAMALMMLPDVTDACSEPFATHTVFPQMLVSRLASEKAKVVLSGDGGDELFWGYAGRFASVLQIAQEFRQPRWLRSGRWWLNKYFRLGQTSSQVRFPDIGSWYRAKHTRFPEVWLRSIFPNLPGWPKNYPVFEFNEYDPDITASWLRWNEMVCHLTLVLLKVDRASMYHSLEVRVPLLDRELVELATRVDWKTCLDLRTMTGKLPLRYSLSRQVKFQTQEKRGFAVPIGDWLRGPLRPIFEECVMDRNEILGLPIHKAKLREFYRLHLDQVADYGPGLWLLLSLVLWDARHYRRENIPGFENFSKGAG